MILEDKVIVVTGAANGIGRACCERFSRERPRGIVVADIDDERARQVAESIGALPVTCDVRDQQAIEELVAAAESAFGPIDLFFSNAGIGIPGGLEVSDADWRNIIEVNFLGHLYAARAVIPSMLDRGGGYLLHTSSAAGLLTEMSSAPYAVTKHAVVSLAEWLAIEYGDQGLKVSCLCPQGVRTNMLQDADGPFAQKLIDSSLSPEQVADCVVAGLHEERFLILPHPEVGEYFRRKADDYDRWLRGMRRLRREITDTDKPADHTSTHRTDTET
jgi:NAD(P)-dependent dehydrogenase (short-subunit alcohol dehydrogenase family)